MTNTTKVSPICPENYIKNEIKTIESRIKKDREESNQPEVASDPLDRAALLQSQQIASSVRFHDGERLKALKKALIRIKEDDYGFCESCGDDIEKFRLKARPEAEMCITCADSAFHKSKQMAG
jgi:DnaK suppressor protein